ncbi:MAG: hypothetical protein ACI3U2_04395 [Anaerovibrio sp.]
MPIPFILGAAALAAAGYGVKKGLDAKEDYELAEDNNKRAASIVDDTKKDIEHQRKYTKKSIEKLGNKKIKILSGSIKEFVEAYKTIKNIELQGSQGIDELKNFKPESPQFQKLNEVSIEASSMLAAAGGSVAAGTALAAGTYGAVMSGGFAFASTGASIAGLSGVAATNATLAWLGGGALSTGAATAFGVTGGMAVLGGLVAGPALAIGGAFMASKAEEAYYESRSNVAKAEKFAEEGKNICAMLEAVDKRAGQLEDLLHGLDHWFKGFNKDMIRTIEYSGRDFRSYSVEDKQNVFKAAMTAQAIKTVLDTSLLTEDGKLTTDSEKSLATGQAYLDKLEMA